MRMRKKFSPLMLVWLVIALMALIGCQPKNPVIPKPGEIGGGPAITGPTGTGTVIGRVREITEDGVTKRASSGARVTIIDARNNVFGANGEVVTDSRGFYIVNGVAAGQAKITASKGGFATDPNKLLIVNVRAGETLNVDDMDLLSGVITGKVLILLATGERVAQAGARVVAVPGTTAGQSATDAVQLATTSNDNGDYTFINVKPGSYTITASFTTTANQTLVSNPSIVNVTEGVTPAPTLLLQENLTTTRDVFGKVVDSNNNPLANTLVSDKLTGVTTSTAADGTFKLSLTIGPKDVNPRSVSIKKAGARFAQDKALDINAGIQGRPETFPVLVFLDNVLNFQGTVVNKLNPDSPVKASATITIVGNAAATATSNPADGQFTLSGVPQSEQLLLQADGVPGFLKGTAAFHTVNSLRTNNPIGFKFTTDPATGNTTVTNPDGITYTIASDGTTITNFKIPMRPVGAVQIPVILKDDFVPTPFNCPGQYGDTTVFALSNQSFFPGATQVRVVITDPIDGSTISNDGNSLPQTQEEDVKCTPQGSQQPVVIGQRKLGNIGVTIRVDNVPGGTQIISVTAATTTNRTGIEVKVPAGNVIVAPLIRLEFPGASSQLGDVTGTVFFVDNFGNLDQNRKLSWVTVDLVNPDSLHEGRFATNNPYGRQPVTILPLVSAPFGTGTCQSYVTTFATSQGGVCDATHKPLSEKIGINNITGLDTWQDLNNDGVQNDVDYPAEAGQGFTVQNVNQKAPVSQSGHGYMLLSSDFNGNNETDVISADIHTGNRSVSDGAGNFTLHNVPEGSSFVSAFKPGFLPKKVALNNVIGGQVNVAPIFGISPIAGSLSGQVFSGTGVGNPLASVTVTADSGTANAISTVTDDQGFYVFRDLSAGQHTVTATVSGVTQTLTVTVNRSVGLPQQDFRF